MRTIFRKQKKVDCRSKDDIDLTSATTATTASTIISDDLGPSYNVTDFTTSMSQVISPTFLTNLPPHASQDSIRQSDVNAFHQVDSTEDQVVSSSRQKKIYTDDHPERFNTHRSKHYASNQQCPTLAQEYQAEYQIPQRADAGLFERVKPHTAIPERRDEQEDGRNFVNKMMSVVAPLYLCGASYVDKAEIANQIQCGQWQRLQELDDASVGDDRSFVTTSTLMEEMYLLERMNSWSTLGTMNTNTTTNSYQKCNDNSSYNSCCDEDCLRYSKNDEKLYFDDDGNLIHPDVVKAHERRRNHIAQQHQYHQRQNPDFSKKKITCSLRTGKQKKSQRKKVSFHYPPVQSLRQIPRIDPSTKHKLFFSEEELLQFENEGYDTDESITESNKDSAAYISAKELARSYSALLAEQENWPLKATSTEMNRSQMAIHDKYGYSTHRNRDRDVVFDDLYSRNSNTTLGEEESPIKRFGFIDSCRHRPDSPQFYLSKQTIPGR